MRIIVTVRGLELRLQLFPIDPANAAEVRARVHDALEEIAAHLERLRFREPRLLNIEAMVAGEDYAVSATEENPTNPAGGRP